MNQDSLVLILTFFVGLVALSQIGQAIALVQLSRRAKAIQDQLAAFTPRAEAVLVSAKDTLEQSRKQIAEVTSKANEILDTTRTQLHRVEELLTDVTSRAKVQMDHVEMVMDDTLGRVHETIASVHTGVMKPLKEINGISKGIQAAISHMLKGGRPTPAQATHDEEMFI